MSRPRPRKARPTVDPPPPPPPHPLTPSQTARFGRDVERMGKRGEDMEKFRAVIEALYSREPLARELNDHPLKGDWKG